MGIRYGVRTAPPSGWLAISAAAPLEIFEKGRRLGRSQGRLALSAGRHELEVVTASLGVRMPATVTIVDGRTSSIRIRLEPGIVNINAVPWASVRVDGSLVGDTPRANLRIPPGKHTVVFTHPALGQRRTTVIVPSGAPLRVSMDMTK